MICQTRSQIIQTKQENGNNCDSGAKILIKFMKYDENPVKRT